jgi:hypothetical protein
MLSHFNEIVPYLCVRVTSHSNRKIVSHCYDIDSMREVPLPPYIFLKGC